MCVYAYRSFLLYLLKKQNTIVHRMKSEKEVERNRIFSEKKAGENQCSCQYLFTSSCLVPILNQFGSVWWDFRCPIANIPGAPPVKVTVSASKRFNWLVSATIATRS